jgi:uncharacterized protein (DUF58 family)
MKIRIVYFVIPLIIGITASITGFSLIWRLFILSLLIPLASYLWTFFILRHIEVEIRTLPLKSQTGETIENQVTLANPDKIPRLMLNIKESSNVPDYRNESIVNLMPGKRLQIKTRVFFPRRGQYLLGAYQLSSGDPLGLFKTTRSFGTPQNIVVYPGTMELPFFDPLHYLSPGFGPGRWVSPQSSFNVSSIRDYASGDSLKHVHWRTTAHSSKMMVKVYDPDRSQNSAKNIWIVCDMQGNIQAGSGLQSTEEYIMTITASIAKKYIEQAWPLGLMTQAERSYHYPLESGSLHLDSIYSSLAIMQAKGQTPLEQLLVNESGHFDLNSMTIVITPSWNEPLVRTLLQIKRQQGILVAILLDSGTFGGKGTMSNIPTALQANGVQVYVVKNGDNLDMSLDSRKL